MALGTNYYFLRHGKLRLPYKDHSEMPFDLLCDLASEKINPPADQPGTLSLLETVSSEEKINFRKVRTLLSSPSKRSLDTAATIREFFKDELFNVKKVEVVEELREVRFDLKEMFRNELSERIDLKLINERVLRGMVEKGPVEKWEAIYPRIESLFRKLEGLPLGDVLLVSHDFFMRAIEVFIRKKIFEASVEVTSTDFLNTQRNSYLHGFRTNSLLSEFSPL